ncbi:ABC transporter permease [Salipiger sp. PrR002]|uniref:ABC transporter permease n=1 Tax=Salipiger sp. PrR002 TaxID=2706489 RepID=UPI0013BB76C6|nr:ABC transporter permease [Salipiger sp. PrR002]NDW01329.1 ABC transporter permease [Salipiger sp. PrR002]NDW58882.1 ABC transporter permease [Salipiger sp. PrR004]
MSSTDFAPPATPTISGKRSFPSARAVAALILREMATGYGRSPGGYIWAILEPVGGIVMLSLAFSAIMRAPALGISFPMFYATGMMPFLMYTDLQGKIASALNFSKPLLAYPTVTFIDAILGRFILEVMTKLLVSYIVFGGIMILYDTRVTLDFPKIFESFALAAFLGLGLGTLMCYVFTRFPLFQKAWGIATKPLFIISCIFFLYQTIPEPYQGYLWYNPLVHIVGLMREGFYPTYDATYVSYTYVLSISGISLTLGLLLLKRFHADILTR